MNESLSNLFVYLQSKNDKVTILKLTEYLGLFNSYDNNNYQTNEYITHNNCGYSLYDNINIEIDLIEKQQSEIRSYIEHVNKTLTKAVHGHDTAKRQVERIIGQWINGEQTGYCFGFEGPPGLGKTSLAKKGIANCLIDNDGTPRPFTFIAIGGASNGSTLEGHNYTYVASTWGRVVDILMEKKCMNPIIFIDELDKVSHTEHGREIIGILTHLIDPTQNDTFQDKYFNGIELDLSKALFIFSYNDVELVDRILLDRIHRIKFNALTLDDKLIIANDYLMPEVLEKMGLTSVVKIPDETMIYIIDKYTNEPGVRKLRQLLFEIVGEINIASLRGEIVHQTPICVSIKDVKEKYLRDRDMIRPYKICRDVATVGVINGLYANTLGRGGVLPIEVSVLPSSQLLELRLTGMQGDVMKESMNVARTLAFELAQDSLNDRIKEYEDKSYKYGLHIHVPEGATKKDGPSAGTAITISIYSRISGVPIKHDVAITGEICLSGKVTAIGGLEEKVLGGIKAGVKHFVFPKENMKDFDKIKKTYGDKNILDGIEFSSVETIYEAMEIALEK
jgi:ATP-dependent Lon protease